MAIAQMAKSVIPEPKHDVAGAGLDRRAQNLACLAVERCIGSVAIGLGKG